AHPAPAHVLGRLQPKFPAGADHGVARGVAFDVQGTEAARHSCFTPLSTPVPYRLPSGAPVRSAVVNRTPWGVDRQVSCQFAPYLARSPSAPEALRHRRA